jgi:N-acetylmuramoyl-L-alanine amidase
MRLRRFPIFAVLLAAFLGGVSPSPVRADVWNIVKRDNREYLTMRNVAEFYRLSYLQSGERTITLSSPGCTIRGDVGSKELIINGVKFIMSSDLVESSGEILLSRLDLTKLVEPVLRPNRIRGAAAIRTVVIDPGHGGYDLGATSVYGNEKDFALDVGLRLRELLLKRGLHVEMTRSNDTFVPLQDRANFANRFRDGIFVCIHFNAGSESATGVETYTLAPRFVPSTGDDSPSASYLMPCAGNLEDPENMALATAMHASLLNRLPMYDRGIKRARFCVLRLTTIPGVLIEGGFVSNPQEAARIAQPAYRQAEAEAISLAIQNYQNATNVPGPPPMLVNGDTTGDHPSLSITPGQVQTNGTLSTIGETAPMDQVVNRIRAMREQQAQQAAASATPSTSNGPTVTVPHN